MLHVDFLDYLEAAELDPSVAAQPWSPPTEDELLAEQFRRLAAAVSLADL